MQQKYYLWLVLLAGLIIGAGAWLLFVPKSALAPSPAAQNTTSTTTGVTVGTMGSSTVTIGEIAQGKTPAEQPPALRPINYSAGTSADLKAALQSQYNTLSAQLKASPTRVDLWLSLGTDYKIAGDYAGAIAAWGYVARTGPSSINYVAYANLGDLYLNFLHDYAKAVANYKAALAIKPGNADYQADLKEAQELQAKQ